MPKLKVEESKISKAHRYRNKKKMQSQIINTRLRLNIKHAKLMGILSAHKLSKDNFKYILEKVQHTPIIAKFQGIINPKFQMKNTKEAIRDEDFEVSQELRKVLDEYKEIKKKDREMVNLTKLKVYV